MKKSILIITLCIALSACSSAPIQSEAAHSMISFEMLAAEIRVTREAEEPVSESALSLQESGR